jgi:hypothetical protein
VVLISQSFCQQLLTHLSVIKGIKIIEYSCCTLLLHSNQDINQFKEDFIHLIIGVRLKFKLNFACFCISGMFPRRKNIIFEYGNCYDLSIITRLGFWVFLIKYCETNKNIKTENLLSCFPIPLWISKNGINFTIHCFLGNKSKFLKRMDITYLL